MALRCELLLVLCCRHVRGSVIRSRTVFCVSASAPVISKTRLTRTECVQANVTTPPSSTNSAVSSSHDSKNNTQTFNGPLSGTTQVSRYQKGKTNLDFIGARDSEWQWHQLGHMQICPSLQTNNHASTPPLSFFRGRMPFLPPNQQHQSTEGEYHNT